MDITKDPFIKGFLHAQQEAARRNRDGAGNVPEIPEDILRRMFERYLKEHLGPHFRPPPDEESLEPYIGGWKAATGAMKSGTARPQRGSEN